MFEDWSYPQILRVIGQSMEERGVGDFSLVWQNDEFVLFGKRVVPSAQRWVDKLLGQTAAHVERKIEIHYNLQSVLWLQIRGESMRKDPNQMPDYFRLSQTLRTVGSYVESRGMPIVSLRRAGGTLFLELQERSGNTRVEEHGMGSFENYFLRTYLRGRKVKPS